MEGLNYLLPYFTRGENAWGTPGIFSGIHSLKIPRNWAFLLIGYLLSLYIYIIFHQILFKPIIGDISFLLPGSFVLLLLVYPVIIMLFYSSPLQKSSPVLRKYPKFLIYTVIYIFIMIAILLVSAFIELIIVYFYGKIASVFFFPVKIGIVYFFEYRVFLAPAYIALRKNPNSILSLLISWEFTRWNWEAAGFFIKRLVGYMLVYGLFFLIVLHQEDPPLSFIAFFYFLIVLYLFIVSASTTVLLYRQMQTRDDLREWIERR